MPAERLLQGRMAHVLKRPGPLSWGLQARGGEGVGSDPQVVAACRLAPFGAFSVGLMLRATPVKEIRQSWLQPNCRTPGW